jgi:hypothetical protein
MTDKQKIIVPRFIDDPLVGRCIGPLPVIGFSRDKIIIENGMLKYIGAQLSGISNKSFALGEITKILIRKKRVSSWTKDFKLDPYAPDGTEIAIALVGIDGKIYELIPSFMLGAGDKHRFSR